MYPLCRHLQSNGRYCQSPALKGHLRCFHHQQIKTRVRQRTACDFTLPLVYPEDRAAVQLNLHLIAQALIYGRMEPRTAHALTHTYRACMANLRHGPLLEADPENTVERIILTPEGEEIAPPREQLEEDEQLTHGHDCPCRKCAEQFRGVAPEQHHAHCKCGFCGTESQGAKGGETKSTETKGAETKSIETQITEAEAVKGAEMEDTETKDAETSGVKGAETQAAETQAEKTQATEMKNTVRVADAQKLYAKEPEKLRADPSPSGESPYKRIIREYEARQAAIEAGLIAPDPPQPIDPDGPYAQGKRKDEEINAQIERNKQAGHELWLKRFGHLQQNHEPMQPQQPSPNINR